MSRSSTERRERVIVTGGRRFGWRPPGSTAAAQRIAAAERALVVETLARELRIKTAWAHDRLLVVVGDATGVDAITRECCETWGLSVEVHRADWRNGRRAGPERNGQMVAGGAIRCIAFPGGNGTHDCIRQALAADIAVTDFST